MHNLWRTQVFHDSFFSRPIEQTATLCKCKQVLISWNHKQQNIWRKVQKFDPKTMAPSTSSFWGEVRHLARPYYIVNIVLCLSFIVLKVGVRFLDSLQSHYGRKQFLWYPTVCTVAFSDGRPFCIFRLLGHFATPYFLSKRWDFLN